MTGTVRFEKIKDGSPYKTAFYTEDASSLIADGVSGSIGSATQFREMYTGELEPVGTKTVRSYEVYIDITDDDTNDVVTRLAKVTKDDATDFTDYDAVVTALNPIVGSVLGTKTLTITNKTNNNADFRVVFVCEVT